MKRGVVLRHHPDKGGDGQIFNKMAAILGALEQKVLEGYDLCR